MRLRGKQLDAINSAIKSGGDFGAALQHTCEQAEAVGQQRNPLVPFLLAAAEKMDWGQVIANGGPPCFHLCGTSFCGRAQRWVGHEVDHPFVSLPALLLVASKPVAS